MMIGEALALCASDRQHSAFFLGVPEGNAVIVAEIKFRQVTVQVFLRAMPR